LEQLRRLFPFKSCLHIRFRGRHLHYRCRPMSNNVSSVIFGSGMVENVGIAIGIASPSVSVQKLFPLPVSLPTFELPMSANVGQCRQCHIQVGHGRKCRIAYRIASLSLPVQKLCFHACLASAILKFARRSTCHVTNFTGSWGFCNAIWCGQLL